MYQQLMNKQQARNINRGKPTVDRGWLIETTLVFGRVDSGWQ